MSTLIFGLQVTVIGFGVVFLALYLLTILIQLQENFFQSYRKKSLDKTQVVKTEQIPVIVTPEIKEDNQEEIIAVIAAAISACGHQVIVKNIKRVYGNTGVPWSTASRTDNMNLRQISIN